MPHLIWGCNNPPPRHTTGRSGVLKETTWLCGPISLQQNSSYTKHNVLYLTKYKGYIYVYILIQYNNKIKKNITYKRWAKEYDISSNLAANSSKIPPHPLAKLQSSPHKYYLIKWLQTQQLIFHKEAESYNCTHTAVQPMFWGTHSKNPIHSNEIALLCSEHTNTPYNGWTSIRESTHKKTGP